MFGPIVAFEHTMEVAHALDQQKGIPAGPAPSGRRKGYDQLKGAHAQAPGQAPGQGPLPASFRRVMGQNHNRFDALREATMPPIPSPARFTRKPRFQEWAA